MSRFWLRARSRAALALPPFTGSLFRGVFGAALRELSCLTGASTCTGCTLDSRCPYALLMEPRVLDPEHRLPPSTLAPHPWVLEPPVGPLRLSAGDTLTFSLVIFGRSHAQLALILLAFRRALTKGLGSQRVALDLIGIRREDEQHWSPIDTYVPKLATPVAVPAAPRDILVQLQSPLRILCHGKTRDPSNLRFFDFFGSLQRRLGLLEQLQGEMPSPWDYRDALAQAKQCEWVGEEQILVKVERYSSRQKREMSWFGVQGIFRIEALPEVLWPVLYRGQWTHTGKGVSFGLGKYRILSDKFAVPEC